MSGELLPCPFCGGDASEGQVYYGGDWNVWCENHNLRCPVFPKVTEREQAGARAAWNTRAPLPPKDTKA